MSTASAVVPIGYKQTEVGVIPEDWSVKQLGSLLSASPKYGINAPAVAFDLNLPTYIRITDISPDGYFIHDNKKSVIYPFSNLYQLSEGNIVFARTGASVGKSYMYNPKDGELVFAGFLIKVEPNIRLLYPNYLKFIVQTQTYWSWILENSMRSGQPGINGKQYATLRIPLPPTITEQEYIGDTINDCEILIESLQELVAKSKYLKQSAMQELLTGKTRVPGFSGDFRKTKLKEFVNEFIVPMRDKPKTFSGQIPWCRIEDFDGKYLFDSKSGRYVTEETINQMNLKVYPVDTVLVSCSANLGRCAIVKRELVTNQTFIGLVVNESKASYEYLFYQMKYIEKELNNQSSGTTISYLSREEFEDLSVLIPSSKKEQEAIAEVLSDMDAEIATLVERLEKAKAIKQGMMQQLLTGKIRLID